MINKEIEEADNFHNYFEKNIYLKSQIKIKDYVILFYWICDKFYLSDVPSSQINFYS